VSTFDINLKYFPWELGHWFRRKLEYCNKNSCDPQSVYFVVVLSVVTAVHGTKLLRNKGSHYPIKAISHEARRSAHSKYCTSTCVCVCSAKY